MKTIKLTSLAAAILLCVSSLIADDTYVATLSGIDCNGCKQTIAQSLGKLEGVKTIRISKVSDDTHRMTIITDGSASLSKQQADNALKKADHYRIKSWSKKS